MKLKHHNLHKQNINLIGQFVGYEVKDGYKVKRMQLRTADGVISVKLTKVAKACLFRLSCEIPMQPGTLLSLAVEPKYDDGQLKYYKVHDLQVLAVASERVETELTRLSSTKTQNSGKQTRVRVCDRGTCRKRGSAQIYEQLQQAISDRNLGDQVILERSSCLKKCKQGPNIAVGKACHSRVCTATVVNLLPS